MTNLYQAAIGIYDSLVQQAISEGWWFYLPSKFRRTEIKRNNSHNVIPIVVSEKPRIGFSGSQNELDNVRSVIGVVSEIIDGRVAACVAASSCVLPGFKARRRFAGSSNNEVVLVILQNGVLLEPDAYSPNNQNHSEKDAMESGALLYWDCIPNTALVLGWKHDTWASPHCWTVFHAPEDITPQQSYTANGFVEEVKLRFPEGQLGGISQKPAPSIGNAWCIKPSAKMSEYYSDSSRRNDPKWNEYYSGR